MVLEVKTRETFGKKVNALRKEGFVPGEVYGHGAENIHISVSEKELLKTWKEAGENTVVTLKLDSPAGGEFSVLIAGVSLDHITGRPLTVDFRLVKKGEKMTVHVPVILSGQSPAEKEGLTIMQTLQEIEVESLPENIPHEFSVNVSPLAETGQSISVKDLIIPKGVEILTDKQTVIVTVAEPEEEEITSPSATAEEKPTETPTAATNKPEEKEKSE